MVKGPQTVRDLLRVKPRSRVTLSAIDPSSTPGIRKAAAKAERDSDQKMLRALQERLYAEGKRSLLVVLQGTDTAGKDGTIVHVFASVDPQGVQVTSFKAPTDEEKAHDFLWRIRNALPSAGRLGIFNRSHYEDVLIVRVRQLVPEAVWSKRYGQIKQFEKELSDSGTAIVKIMLHISPEEQRKRLLARLKDPTKQWKFNPKDLDERALWSEYQVAYEAALSKTSVPAAPWYVVPANKKWYRDWAVSRILIETLQEMDPQYPKTKMNVRALEARLAKPRVR